MEEMDPGVMGKAFAASLASNAMDTPCDTGERCRRTHESEETR